MGRGWASKCPQGTETAPGESHLATWPTGQNRYHLARWGGPWNAPVILCQGWNMVKDELLISFRKVGVAEALILPNSFINLVRIYAQIPSKFLKYFSLGKKKVSECFKVIRERKCWALYLCTVPSISLLQPVLRWVDSGSVWTKYSWLLFLFSSLMGLFTCEYVSF